MAMENNTQRELSLEELGKVNGGAGQGSGDAKNDAVMYSKLQDAADTLTSMGKLEQISGNTLAERCEDWRRQSYQPDAMTFLKKYYGIS